MPVMRAANATLRRSIGQRFASSLVACALGVAPILANVWPAFGKGEMFYVGGATPAAHGHAAHDGSAAHEGHADHANHADHQGHAALDRHAGHQVADAGSHHSPAQHQAHCALCELAFLGWAPPLDLSLGCAEACPVDRTVPIAAVAPRLLALWPSAQARAPPLA